LKPTLAARWLRVQPRLSRFGRARCKFPPTLAFDGVNGATDFFSADTTAILYKSSAITTLSEIVTFTATRAGISSGDASLQAPPTVPDSGLTIVLMGFGIGVLVLFSTTRRRRA